MILKIIWKNCTAAEFERDRDARTTAALLDRRRQAERRRWRRQVFFEPSRPQPTSLVVVVVIEQEQGAQHSGQNPIPVTTLIKSKELGIVPHYDHNVFIVIYSVGLVARNLAGLTLFLSFCCLSGSASVDGNLAESAGQLGKMLEH